MRAEHAPHANHTLSHRLGKYFSMNNIPPTSAELILALQSQSPAKRESAWARFDPLYRPVILAWCGNRYSSEVAEDLTQDVLQKLSVQFLRNCYDSDRGRFRSWLKAVVNNAMNDYARKVRRQPGIAGAGGTEHGRMLAELVDPAVAERLSEVIMSQPVTKAARAIAAVRGRVQDAHWQAFCLVYVEELSTAEAAAKLGLNVSNVHKITQRVQKQLREEIDHG
jgi:RNA polymerase sigma factor (sigma-70 family)